LFRFCIFVQIRKLFIFWILFIFIKLFIFWFLFKLENCLYKKNVHIWKKFKFENCSYFEFVHIWKMFIYEICSSLKIVHIFEFWKLFIFQILFLIWKLFIFRFFVQTWKLFIFRILFKFEKKKKKQKQWISWATAQLGIPTGRVRGPSCPRRQRATYRRPNVNQYIVLGSLICFSFRVHLVAPSKRDRVH
jgi:hypothetical protein